MQLPGNKVINGLFEIWGPSGNGPSSLHDLVSADGIAVLAEPWGFSVGDSPGAATTIPTSIARTPREIQRLLLPA